MCVRIGNVDGEIPAPDKLIFLTDDYLEEKMEQILGKEFRLGIMHYCYSYEAIKELEGYPTMYSNNVEKETEFEIEGIKFTADRFPIEKGFSTEYTWGLTQEEIALVVLHKEGHLTDKEIKVLLQIFEQTDSSKVREIIETLPKELYDIRKTVFLEYMDGEINGSGI